MMCSMIHVYPDVASGLVDDEVDDDVVVDVMVDVVVVAEEEEWEGEWADMTIFTQGELDCFGFSFSQL